jgi:hypothetical protein
MRFAERFRKSIDGASALVVPLRPIQKVWIATNHPGERPMSSSHWMYGGDLNPAGSNARAPMPGVVQSEYLGGRNGEQCMQFDAINLAAAKTHKTWERPSGNVRGGYG